MEIVVKKADPKTQKDIYFQIEAHVEEYIDRAEAYVVLDNVPYLIQVRFPQDKVG